MALRRIVVAAVLTLLVGALLPATIAAHSELVSSSPTDGAGLAGSPTEVIGDFTEDLDPTSSVMELHAPGGALLATGGVPDGGPATRMAIVDMATLVPGAYEVRWTTVTPDDGGVERGTFMFTVAPAQPSPSSPGQVSTAGPSSTSQSSPAPAPAAGSSPGDLLVPLAVLAGILVAGAVWLLRRRR